MRRMLLVSMLCAALFARLPLSAACGGYEFTPIDGMVKFSDLVVYGRIEFVDKLGTNFVLNVDRYFKGSGNQYLSVVNWRPAVYFADTVRDYDHGCLSLSPGRGRFSAR